MDEQDPQKRVDSLGRTSYLYDAMNLLPKHIELQLPKLKTHLAEHGWAIFRQIFPIKEIQKLRATALNCINKRNLSSMTHVAENLLVNADLGHIVYDDRILSIARFLLDTPRPLYLGDAGLSASKKSMYPNGFHKDCPDREDGNAPDWTTPHDMIRFGLYLQDHSKQSGGLYVRDRSHTRACITSEGKVNPEWGEKVYLRTSPGDLAVWSYKTSHAGPSSVPKWQCLESFVPTPALTYLSVKIPSLFEPFEDNRIGIFIGFGNDREVARRYLNYMKTRTFGIEAGLGSKYSEEIQEKVREKMDLLDTYGAMNGLHPQDGSNKHKEIPY